MAWSRVQAKPATSGGAGVATLTATFTSTPVTGNKVIVYVSQYGTISSVKDGNNNSLTKVANITNGTGGTEITELWVYDVPATPSTAIKASFTPNQACSMVAQEVSGLAAGVATATIFDGTAATLSTSVLTGGTASGPTYSSTAASEYLIETLADNGQAATFSTPSGYSMDVANTDSGSNTAIAYKNSTAGSETITWASSNSWGGATDNLAMIAVAFTLASATHTFAPHRMPLGA